MDELRAFLAREKDVSAGLWYRIRVPTDNNQLVLGAGSVSHQKINNQKGNEKKKMDNDETNGDGHGRKSHCPLIDVGLTTDIYEADLLLQTVLRNAIHTRNRSSF